MLGLARKVEVRNTPKVLVLILTQSHASFVALGKSFYVLMFSSLPVDWGQWPPPAKEGEVTQHSEWHRVSRK